MSFYAQRFAGEISNRTKMNDEIADVLSGQLATTAIDSLTVVFYAAIMIQYDWILTLLVVGFAAINIFSLQWISRQRVDANQKLMQDYGKAAGTSISGLQSIETLKASGLESDFFAKWSGYYTKAANSMQDMGVTNQAIAILPVLLSSLSSTFLLIVGGWRIMSGDLSIGMFVAFQGLMQNFQEPITNLVGFGGELQELEGKLTRLDDVLQNSIDPELQARKVDGLTQYAHARTTVLSRLQGYVELRNITYGYSPLDPPLIENFNLSIKPGERVALVGGSGSGKSTIAKLINGIFQIWSGEILFDGQPKQTIPHQILTNSVTTIEQDILLFGGTVRDNLTLWDTTVSDRDLQQACQDAAIDDIIQSMPGGYNAELKEGATNLSGGQRQRLEIARALVNNPSILIMDEATSALDAETEKIIDRNIRRRGCSCIVVAHRLSTIRDCDQIIVLEKGKVVQRGTHDELWQQEGVYSRLIGSEGGGL
jgi:ATP-binding cassette, subfamily C, bacterial